MAILKLNPIIRSWHGRWGNAVLYFRNGVQCARSYAKPENPDTEAQRRLRRTFGNAVRSWQAISESERYAFNRKARYLNMSGYNLYISRYMGENIRKTLPGPAASTPGNARFTQPYHVRINSVSESIPNRSLPKAGLFSQLLCPG